MAVAGLLATLPAFAQDEEGGGFLAGLIEDSLSGAGREVQVTGFRGALSARATLDTLTIADDEGVWLILRDAELDWNRGALLRGHLEVTALTARSLEVTRIPASEGGFEAPSPAARDFKLPGLPVSVEIGRLAIERAALDAPVLGVAAVLSLDGRVSLAGGEGAARLDVTRIDGIEGRIALDASFANATQELAVSLTLSEAPGGIAATLLNLPGVPSVALSVEGAGPLTDFGADIALATDGAERLAGRVTIAGAEEGGRRFAADIAGDLAPVFAPEYRPFFGDRIALVAEGVRAATGGTVLDSLSLTARSLSVSGSAEIAPDGLPERFSLTGEIAEQSGAPVLLPLPGVPTRIARAVLDVAFDAAADERWTARIEAQGLDRTDLSAERLVLDGGGRIARDAELRSVTAVLDLDGEALRFGTEALATAFGDRLDARVELGWQDGAPLEIGALALSAAGLSVSGTGRVSGFDTGVTLAGTAEARVADLAPFSDLAGRSLAGAAEARIEGSGSLLGGAFDISLSALGRDLVFGVPQADPLWRGQSRLDLVARRDGTGTNVETFLIRSDHGSAGLSGRIAPGAGTVTLRAEVNDTGALIRGASGPARLQADATLDGETWTVDAQAEGPGALSVRFDGDISDLDGAGGFDGTAELSAADLSVWAPLIGQRLAGALTARISGTGRLAERAFDVAAEATGRNLALGIPEADRLLSGASRLSVSADGADGRVTVRRAEATTPQLTASGSGAFSETEGMLALRARLTDLGVFTPDIRGPAAVDGRAERTVGGWRIRFDGTGPGGTELRGAGTVEDGFGRADMEFSGRAPLALANARIAPLAASGTLSFDLRLNGPPGLAALSGRVSTADARITSATPRLVLNDVAARITLSGARAQVSASAAVDRGGRIAVEGPVTLSPPFGADLVASLSGVALSDPDLYETTVDARLTVRGPLAGGAAIGGQITLGETELRIPSTGVGATGAIPEIMHVNEPASVRTTRSRAGLLGGGNGAGAAPAFPIDILIRAPRRIFIRGRGLDAELGGQLRLAGSTSNVLATGGFDLIRGRLDFLGRRLVLTQGSAQLQGPFLPYLRLTAQADAGSGTTVFISVDGPADAPTITFRSDPELPEDEVLARLLFGKSVSELSALQAARLAAGVASLAGVGGLGLIGKLRTGAGLADLDVTTGDDGETRVTAGTYLGENLYTDVTVGGDRTEFKLNLDLSPSVTARGTVDTDGDTSLGIFFERDY